MSKPRGKKPIAPHGYRAWNGPDASTSYHLSLGTRTPPGCVGCIHTARFNGSHTFKFCNYLENTGISRVAIKAFHGPEGGCRVKEEMGTGKKRRWREEINVRRRELYDQGYTDTKIAAMTGCTASTVCTWRKKNGLKSNYKPMGKENRP